MVGTASDWLMCYFKGAINQSGFISHDFLCIACLSMFGILFN